MALVVAGSAVLFTVAGPFIHRAVGLDSPVGNCSPVGNNSPVGNESQVKDPDHDQGGTVGSNSPVGDCSPVSSTRTPTDITLSLSGGGHNGHVITVPANTPVTGQATLTGGNGSSEGDNHGAGSSSEGTGDARKAGVLVLHAQLTGSNVSQATGTVDYDVYSLSAGSWKWSEVASGGDVTVTGGVVPPSKPVTLGPGVYRWIASYSGDALNGPSTSDEDGAIEIVMRSCPTDVGGTSGTCPGGDDDHGNGNANGNNEHGNGNNEHGNGNNEHGNGNQGNNEHGSGNNEHGSSNKHEQHGKSHHGSNEHGKGHHGSNEHHGSGRD